MLILCVCVGGSLCMHLYSPFDICVCLCSYLHTAKLCVSIPAGLCWIARSAWVSSQGKIEAARCGNFGLLRISLPWVCSRPKQEPPSRVSSRWTPHLRWGGGYRLTCCPAVRSGIKLQVERESIPRLEWGGNKKVCRYLQSSWLAYSNCGRLSCLIFPPWIFCSLIGNPAISLSLFVCKFGRRCYIIISNRGV